METMDPDRTEESQSWPWWRPAAEEEAPPPPPPTPPPATEAEGSKKRTTPLWAAAVVAALTGATAGGGVAVATRGTKTVVTGSPTTAPSVSSNHGTTAPPVDTGSDVRGVLAKVEPA